MAKKSSVIKNNKRVALAAQYNAKRLELKALVKDRSLSLEDRLAAQDKLQAIPRNASPVRIRRRCAITGRARAYMGFFNLSRIKFREYALQGILPGVRKASW